MRKKGFEGDGGTGAGIGFSAPTMLLEEFEISTATEPIQPVKAPKRAPVDLQEPSKNATVPVRPSRFKGLSNVGKEVRTNNCDAPSDESKDESISWLNVDKAIKDEEGWRCAATAFVIGAGGELLIDETCNTRAEASQLTAEMKAFSQTLEKIQAINYSEWGTLKVTSPSSHLVGHVRVNLFSFLKAGVFDQVPPEPFGGVSPEMKTLSLKLAEQIRETGVLLRWATQG